MKSKMKFDPGIVYTPYIPLAMDGLKWDTAFSKVDTNLPEIRFTVRGTNEETAKLVIELMKPKFEAANISLNLLFSIEGSSGLLKLSDMRFDLVSITSFNYSFNNSFMFFVSHGFNNEEAKFDYDKEVSLTEFLFESEKYLDEIISVALKDKV